MDTTKFTDDDGLGHTDKIYAMIDVAAKMAVMSLAKSFTTSEIPIIFEAIRLDMVEKGMVIDDIVDRFEDSAMKMSRGL